MLKSSLVEPWYICVRDGVEYLRDPPLVTELKAMSSTSRRFEEGFLNYYKKWTKELTRIRSAHVHTADGFVVEDHAHPGGVHCHALSVEHDLAPTGHRGH